MTDGHTLRHDSEIARGGTVGRGPQRVFLHVGVPKTGTTFLQSVLAASRSELQAHGVQYPGSGAAHFLAAQDLTDHLFLGRENPRVAGAWDKLVRQTRRASGTVVISHELFTHAEAEHIERAVTDLTPAEIHVVLTIRDFERQLPAVWQERLKNGGKVSFARHFSQAIDDAAARPQQTVGFWRQQDAATIAARWAAVIPADRIHIITVPQAGAPKDLLWRRFCQVIGVDPAIIDLSRVPTSGNVSLRPPQARLLRRVNQRLKGTLTPSVYRTVVKRYLSESATASANTMSVYGLNEEQRAVAARWSDDLRTAVAAGGYTVIGDLDELTAPAAEEASIRPFDEVPDSEEAEATVMATAALVRWMATLPQTDDRPPPRSDRSG